MTEIRRIQDMGVEMVLKHKVEDVQAEKDAGGFDAVFIAVGAHISKHVEIPARDAVRVLDAISMLHDVRMGESPLLGRRVVIYGGGNTAMDAARTARRLGADEALIIYRRDGAHMPAHAFEADEALSEGVKIKWLTSIKEVVGPDLTVEMMELDGEGRPHPTGRLETLRADAIVLALGQVTDTAFLRRVPSPWVTASVRHASVIASLNDTTAEGWIAYAQQIEGAGASDLELTVYFIPTDLTMTGQALEERYSRSCGPSATG